MRYSPAQMLDISKIRAITLDLDDTLWPIWPTISRAEAVTCEWLQPRAPRTAALFADKEARLRLRDLVVSTRPDLGHNMSALRLESIRQGLKINDEDTALAAAAFDVFFEARMQVDLFADALPALAFLADRFPVVAVSNGNADVNRVGIGQHFRASVSAHEFGVGKPDARIFHAAAKAAGVASHEVLHVGDDAHLDVLGANGAGMQSVWVNRANLAWAHEGRPHVTVEHLGELCHLLDGVSQRPLG